MLLTHVLVTVVAAHLAGFAQGYVAAIAVCRIPPPPPAKAFRAPLQPERGNRRF